MAPLVIVDQTTPISVVVEPQVFTITEAPQPQRVTAVGLLGLSGATGPEGPQGPEGPPGADGADSNYFAFTQSMPSAFWVINHNLNMFPAVTVVTSAGDVVEGDLTYVDPNNLIITFSAAFSGDAYLV